VRTADDALTVLRQASQPLGPMGAEWLQRQEREVSRSRRDQEIRALLEAALKEAWEVAS
jgi:hypothetical protein